MVSLLNTYIKWLSLGNVSTNNYLLLQSPTTWFSKGYKEAFSNGELEPWLFRGGLIGDLQRLLPIDNVNDLFIYRAPESPSSHLFKIRPYLASDEQVVYDICRKTSSMNEDFLFEDLPDLIGDKLVGSFLTFFNDFCFVIVDEIENKVCGYILAAPDSQKFQKKLEIAWLPELCLKYAAPVEKLSKGQELNSAEKFINDLHDKNRSNQFIIFPDLIHNNYPSICRINILDYVLENDASVPKRLMISLLAALKANGSKGVFSIVNNLKEKKELDLYTKLGFQEISCSEKLSSSDDVFLGRII